MEDGRAGGGGLSEAMRPRFVAVPAERGLYESLYFTAHHPTQRRALWVRHTVLKSPGAAPRASLWCTWFNSGDGANVVRAAKLTTPELSSSPDRLLAVGDHGSIGAAGATGAVALEGLRARWNLEFRRPEPPLPHLPQPWMYTAPIPRTKSISAAPHVALGGELEIEGQAVDVDGWPCTIGHNWGPEHAERWLWIHADAAVGNDPVWLDVIVGQVRLGPVTTPWIANGALSIGGDRHRLGGLRHGVKTAVTRHDRGATALLRGRGVTVEARANIDAADCVAWTYADPVGHTREVVNSSVARIDLTVERPGRPALATTAPVSAFELGAARRAFDVPLQPFPD